MLRTLERAIQDNIEAINEINTIFEGSIVNLNRFSGALGRAAKVLGEVKMGSREEKTAVENYVEALSQSNTARSRQALLIEEEIARRSVLKRSIHENADALIQEAQIMKVYKQASVELNKELEKRGYMLSTAGKAIPGVSDAGFGIQGPKEGPPRPIQGPLLPGGGLQLPAGISRLPPQTGFGGALNKLLGGPSGLLSNPAVMEAILGGAFPALFGGGLGAIGGGALGGFAGAAFGGLGGMALSIAFSALGQQLDESLKKVKELGDAVQTIDTDKLRDSFIFVNSELDVSIQRAIRLGDIDRARALMVREIATQTGVAGTAIEDVTNATAMAGNEWKKLSGTVSAALGMIGAPFAAALAGILSYINMNVASLNGLISGVGTLLKGTTEFVFNLLPGGAKLLQHIKDLLSRTNEEQQKLDAAAQLHLDTLKRQTQLDQDILDLELQRTENVTKEGKLADLVLDTEQKRLEIEHNRVEALEKARAEYKGANIEVLRAIEAQINKQADIKIAKEEHLAQLKREKIELDAVVAKHQLKLDLLQQQNSVQQAIERGNETKLDNEAQRLNQQLEYARSLNEQYALLNKIADNRIAKAELTYEATERQLQLAVDEAVIQESIVKAQHKKGKATDEELKKAAALTQTSIKLRDVGIETAAAVRDQAVITEKLERSKKLLAAYAKEESIQTEATNRYLEYRHKLLQAAVTVNQAYANAQTEVNKLKIQELEADMAKLAEGKSRLAQLRGIRELEIANAKIALGTTRQQIIATTETVRLTLLQQQTKQKELEAVANLALHQGVYTKEMERALVAQRDAVTFAELAYQTAVKKANADWRAADAVYKAAVHAADLRLETAKAAEAAGAYADNMIRARGGAYTGKEFGGAYAVSNVALQEQGRALWEAAVKKATSPTANPLTAQRILTEAEMQIANLQQPYRQAQQAQKYESSLQELEKLGIPYTGVTPQYASAYRATQLTPQVNITTGPVTQMNGTNYVTVSDLRQATSAAAQQGANLALSQLRTNPTVRRTVGVAR